MKNMREEALAELQCDDGIPPIFYQRIFSDNTIIFLDNIIIFLDTVIGCSLISRCYLQSGADLPS